MNWIKVIFDEQRTVFADDVPLGDTNQVLMLGESGTYTFHLGEPRNYQPAEVTRQVTATTRRKPLLIEFTS
jgi:hypothetical protein